MRVLLLTHSFNSLTQRLYVELARRGHALAVELDINDAVTIEAVERFRPELILAPYLRRAIPEAVWRAHTCLVVHPGIRGDRGPAALDWAILNGETRWGVTVLQAAAGLDAGDIWAAVEFPMRAATKSSLYRNEVTEAAVQAVLAALARHARGDFRPEPLDYARADVRGRPHPPMRQGERAIDWRADTSAAVLRKIRAADGAPGVLDTIRGEPYYLYDAHEEGALRGAPGEFLARRCGAICRATADGSVWITHLRRRPEGEPGFKLPAERLLGAHLAGVPRLAPGVLPARDPATWQDLWYEERNGVGYLHFAFYNGAMSTARCARLRAAYRAAARRPVRVLVLMGGPDLWSNGLDLNVIEAAASPADESWRNINAMDDLVAAILATPDKITVAAMQGNAGAGGVFLALAADHVLARTGVVLNPHYKNMGNLYGSEYWTYLLPRRAGPAGVEAVLTRRLPLGAPEALALGLIDDCLGTDVPGFRARVRDFAETLARDSGYGARLAAKRARRERDERAKPLAQYRAEELERMHLNFYGFDPSYHVARYNFVHRVGHSRTPLHLAPHRRLGWRPAGTT